jgi:hypothetical protein
VTAWDIDLAGTLSAGTAAQYVYGSKAGQTIGLGTTAKDMHISATELGKLTEDAGLIVGSSQSGTILVHGINRNLVTLLAPRDNAQIEFSGSASQFTRLAAKADNGVLVKTDVTTTSSTLYLDADMDNSSSSDNHNAIAVTDGRLLWASTLMTLRGGDGSHSNCGSGCIVAAGRLTLRAEVV